MAAMTVSTPVVENAAAGMRELISAFTSSEARYFDEERFSEAEVRRALSDGFTDRKIVAMKRILAAVSVGRDASALFPDVVKNVSFQSLELKKLIYIYLVQYAENNRDLALLSINSFQKDLTDRSQLVRASALRAMASIRVLEVIQLVMVAVKNAASDPSPYVRKTAAQCMTKVYSVDPDQFFELRGLLIKLMGDHEVQVVGSAVMAFYHICVVRPPQPATADAAADGGGDGSSGEKGTGDGEDSPVARQLALLHPLFRRLCADALLMDAWAQQSCIDLLLRYCRIFFASPNSAPRRGPAVTEEPKEGDTKPAESEDLKLFLKTLKLLLCSSSQGITMSAVAAICYAAPANELSVVARPLLRCLREAPPESQESLLTAMGPLVRSRPELMRPYIREFFVQSFDYFAVKKLKLEILGYLVDETNVQLVLRELQAYITWQSYPDFVQLAVQHIAKVALKITSVADSCLRGLVKMLDSKCDSLACEAVVALRALLQKRRTNADSGLGAVLPQLARYLKDLGAPSARASVVWIVGQYQQEVPRLAPDVLRQLTKGFAGERQEVKRQIIGLGLKVWAFHSLNARGELPDPSPPEGDDAEGKATEGEAATALAKQPRVTVEESIALLPRLTALVDHINNMASFDSSWDVRDTARALKRLKDVASTTGDGSAGDEAAKSLQALGLGFCRACATGSGAGLTSEQDEAAAANAGGGGEDGGIDSKWKLGSLAQALDFPLDTYRPLPPWAAENSSDDLRKAKVAETPSSFKATSISSDNVGHSQHMENRVQAPSNITNVPVVTSLEDLDLFYSEPSMVPKPMANRAEAAAASGPATTLEQMQLGAGAKAPVGTVIFGEDDESDEEAEEESDEDDSWKYCQSASAQSKTAPKKEFSPPPRDNGTVTAEPVAADAVAADAGAAPAAAEDAKQDAATTATGLDSEL